MKVQNFYENLLTIQSSEEREKFIKGNLEISAKEVCLSLKDKTGILQNNWQEAERYAKICFEIGHIRNCKECLGYGEIAMGNAMLYTGNREEAKKHYAAAFDIFMNIGNEIEAYQSRVGKIQTLPDDEALELAEKVSKFFAENNELERYARLKATKGRIYKNSGEYNKALVAFEEAQDVYEKLNQKQWWLLYLLGDLYLNLGNFEKAQETFEELEKLQVMDVSAFLKFVQSRQRSLTGNYIQAIQLNREAKNKINDSQKWYCDLNLSRIYLYLHRFAEGIEICSANLEIDPAFRINLVIAYLYEKKIGEAERELNWLQKNAPKLLYKTNLLLGNLYFLQNKPDKAISQLQNFMSSVNLQNMDRLTLGTFYFHLARAYFMKGDREKADSNLQSLLDVAGESYFPELLMRCYHLKSKMETQKFYAYNFIQLSLVYLEKMILSIGGIEEFQMSLMEGYLEIYEDAVFLALENDRIEEALEIAEKAKARSLWENIVKHIDLRFKIADEEDRKFEEKLNSLQKKLANKYAKRNRDNDKRPVPENFDAEIHQLEREINKIYENWRRKSIFHQDFLDLRGNIQQPSYDFLEKDELLLEYFIIKDSIVRFEITPKSQKVHKLKISLTEIKNLQEEFKDFIMPGYIEDLKEILREFYVALMPDIDYSEFEIVTLIPHNLLHYLPFHCLYDGENYLIEKCAFRYGHSANVIDLCEKRDNRKLRDIMAVGITETLPYVKEEINAIQSKFRKSHILIDEKVDKKQLINDAPNFNIFHISTHSHLNRIFPYLSFLELLQSSDESNFIFNLSDIYQMNLKNTSLVFLNACDTAHGEIAGADEVIGFARGFFYAGATSVIQTFWQINDQASAEFAGIFYENLNRSESIADALRSAQLTLQNREKWQHPYYWAGFGLWGKAKM